MASIDHTPCPDINACKFLMCLFKASQKTASFPSDAGFVVACTEPSPSRRSAAKVVNFRRMRGNLGRTVETWVLLGIEVRLEFLSDETIPQRVRSGFESKGLEQNSYGGIWTKASEPLFSAGPHTAFIALVSASIQPATLSSTQSGIFVELAPGETPP